MLGEIPVAVVVTKKVSTMKQEECSITTSNPSGDEWSFEQMKTHLSTRLVAYKHPRRLIVTDVIPRNALGKVRTVRYVI